MTCIIGLEHNGKVYLGCDSQVSFGDTKQSTRLDKIFKRGEFLFGVAGYPRIAQILEHSLPLIPQTPSQSDISYLCDTFSKSVKNVFDENDIGNKDYDGSHYGSSIVIFGYRKNLYELDSNYQIIQFSDEFTAIGSGADLALGAMYVLNDLQPKQRILKALEASAYFSIGVSKPFKVMSI